ncbi:MAG: MFS transporter [Luteitalea sp.]|nr:MFS transporter [Luteitalea sp.]
MVLSRRSSAGRRSLFNLPRPVWLLGWVSLATDAASEAIYPVLPFFLTQVLGAGAVSLGVVEGAAEAANSLLKIASGRAADRSRSKRPLVFAGYAISSFVRPLIALAQTWSHVFAIRLLDRVGKGIRGAPRDAMLAGWTTGSTRGKVYGFHRAMDHTGAVVGPLLATVFLYYYPGEYRTLFALTIIPGAIAVLLILLVREDRTAPLPAPDASHGHLAPGPAGEPLPRNLKRFFGVLTIFTLGNSTDAFLLLKLTEVAGSARFIPLMWAGLHVVKAALSVVGGAWSDRIGRRAVIVIGWLVYAAVYAGFAIADALVPLLVCFFAYGIYFGFAEGTEKALVADLAPPSRRGFAFGVHNAVLGLGSLAASVMFGVLWTAFGPEIAFGAGAALALIASALLFVVV